MATAKNKTNLQVELTQPETGARSAAPDTNIESMIADELLDSVDWQQVKLALIEKAKSKFWQWLTSSNNTPINISPFPELSALPSHDDEGKAA